MDTYIDYCYFQPSFDLHPKFEEFRHTTNDISEKLYNIGISLTKPFEDQVNLATKIFSGHFRPGKSFSDLPIKDKIWKIVRGLSLFTIVIPILTALVAILGMLFRLVGSYCRPRFMLLQKKDGNLYQRKPDNGTPITIASYNVGLMPGFARNVNDMRSSHSRAHEISNKLSEELPDIVCLQECFSLKATSILCKNLKDHYSQIVYSVMPNEFGLNSGLVIASKYKIDKVLCSKFTATGGEDSLANKGFVAAKVRFNENKYGWIYNTHLQAKEGKNFDNIRSKQLIQLRDNINVKLGKIKAKSKFITVVGDFNSSEVDESGNSTGIVVSKLLGENFYHIPLSEESKESSWYNKKDPTWGTDNWNQKTVEGCILDHAYTSRLHIQTKVTINDTDTLISGSSDHLPITINYYL